MNILTYVHISIFTYIHICIYIFTWISIYFPFASFATCVVICVKETHKKRLICAQDICEYIHVKKKPWQEPYIRDDLGSGTISDKTASSRTKAYLCERDVWKETYVRDDLGSRVGSDKKEKVKRRPVCAKETYEQRPTKKTHETRRINEIIRVLG